MDYTLKELIDIPQLAKLLDSLGTVQTMPSAIVDMEGNVLTATARQDICTKFHRAHLDTVRQCRERDTFFANKLCDQGEQYIYKCPMGLVDAATPIIVEGKHIGNVFTGQLFLEPPNEAVFLDQARRCGFEEDAYLEVVRKVPVFTEEQLHKNLAFLGQLAEMLASEGLKQKRLMEAEEALQEVAQVNNQIISSAKEGIIVYGTDLRYLVWNPFMEHLTGMKASEVLGKHPEEVFPFLKEAGVIERLEGALAGAVQDPVDFPYHVPGTGRSGWTTDNSVPFRNTMGAVIGVIGTVTEITERKRVEDALRESHEILSLFVRQSPIYTYIKEVTSSQSRVLQASENFQEMIGIPGSAMVGKTMEELYPAEMARKFNADDWAVVSAGKGLELAEDFNGRSYSTVKFPIVQGEKTLLAGFTTDITERKKAERDLLQSELKFRSLFESLTEGVALHELVRDECGRIRDYRILDVNPAYQRHTGLDPAVVRGRLATDLYCTPVPPYLEEYSKVALDGSPHSFETYFPPLGKHFRISVISPMQGQFATVFEDITERKQAEVTLRETNAYLENLINYANAPIIVWDPAFKITRFNHAFEALTGRSETEVLGKPLELLFPPALAENSMALIRKTLTGERWETVEIKILNLDSTVRTVLWNSATLFASDGTTPIATIAQGQEITRRKQAEEALRESENSLRKAQQVAHVGSWTWNIKADRLEWSDEMYCIFGIEQGKFHGALSEVIVQAIHPDDRTAVEQSNLSVTQQGIPIPLEYRVIRPDGTVRVVWAEAGQITLDEAGKPALLAGIVLDITERRQAEEERRILLERVAQIQKLEALGVLVAGVAHNINNVLAAIMATASLRERLASETKDLEAYRTIGAACRRGRDVVQSLTRFAQPVLSNPAPVELHALLTEVRVILGNTTNSRISILEDFYGEPLWIYADAGSINHALMNLCLNALDAMPKGGTLAFRTAIHEEGWVELSVEDSGEGMTPEVLARVKEPFFTTKDVGKGTGLGLSMTYGVMKAHGGDVAISSMLGQGSTVKLRFPRIPAPPALEPVAEVPTPSLGPLNVLLVDDDEDVRFLVTRMLKNADLHINSVPGGAEALESLKVGPLPDLIILDQNMPRLNGMQTMEKIRALHVEVPILISSGQPDIENWECFKLPNVAVISKPFEMGEVLAKLAKMTLKSRIS